MSLAVVVPTPFGDRPAGEIGAHLREAIRKVNNGEYDDAVTEARKAIHVMDAVHGPWPKERRSQRNPRRIGPSMNG